jgi:sigma-E factor negative regulatory protein RseC
LFFEIFPVFHAVIQEKVVLLHINSTKGNGNAISMSDKIRHSGVVDSIDGRCVKVRIVQTSACAACKVASHCNASESKVKLVDVVCDNAQYSLKVGQPVVVSASRQEAGRALLLGFGLPLLLLVGTLVVLTWQSYDEATAALASLAVLLPYYLALWLLRDHISRRISFQIEESIE